MVFPRQRSDLAQYCASAIRGGMLRGFSYAVFNMELFNEESCWRRNHRVLCASSVIDFQAQGGRTGATQQRRRARLRGWRRSQLQLGGRALFFADVDAALTS